MGSPASDLVPTNTGISQAFESRPDNQGAYCTSTKNKPAVGFFPQRRLTLSAAYLGRHGRASDSSVDRLNRDDMPALLREPIPRCRDAASNRKLNAYRVSARALWVRWHWPMGWHPARRPAMDVNRFESSLVWLSRPNTTNQTACTHVAAVDDRVERRGRGPIGARNEPVEFPDLDGVWTPAVHDPSLSLAPTPPTPCSLPSPLVPSPCPLGRYIPRAADLAGSPLGTGPLTTQQTAPRGPSALSRCGADEQRGWVGPAALCLAWRMHHDQISEAPTCELSPLSAARTGRARRTTTTTTSTRLRGPSRGPPWCLVSHCCSVKNDNGSDLLAARAGMTIRGAGGQSVLQPGRGDFICLRPGEDLGPI